MFSVTSHLILYLRRPPPRRLGADRPEVDLVRVERRTVDADLVCVVPRVLTFDALFKLDFVVEFNFVLFHPFDLRCCQLPF